MSKPGTAPLWWIAVVAFAALAALLVVWAAGVVHVALATLLTVAVVIIALAWLIALVRVPWNLHFAARRAAAELDLSRERGISVRPESAAEARRIAARTLWLALGAHAGTALAAALIAYATANATGYYIAGVFGLATAFRPAAAYLSHLRERIGALARESKHPRDDVVALRAELAEVKRSVADLRAQASRTDAAISRLDAHVRDSIAHTRDLLTADLGRLADAQEADRARARDRADELERTLGQLRRFIESSLDGITDHAELIAGLRALVRLIRED